MRPPYLLQSGLNMAVPGIDLGPCWNGRARFRIRKTTDVRELVGSRQSY